MIKNIAAASLDALFVARDETLAFARRYDREFAALSESAKQCRCHEINPDPIWSCHIPCDRCEVLRNAREEWERCQTLEDEIRSRIAL